MEVVAIKWAVWQLPLTANNKEAKSVFYMKL
jgi:hypothetical protein